MLLLLLVIAYGDRDLDDNMVIITGTGVPMAYMVRHFDGNFAFDMLMLLNLGYRLRWGKWPSKICPVVSLTCANTQK